MNRERGAEPAARMLRGAVALDRFEQGAGGRLAAICDAREAGLVLYC